MPLHGQHISECILFVETSSASARNKSRFDGQPLKSPISKRERLAFSRRDVRIRLFGSSHVNIQQSHFRNIELYQEDGAIITNHRTCSNEASDRCPSFGKRKRLCRLGPPEITKSGHARRSSTKGRTQRICQVLLRQDPQAVWSSEVRLAERSKENLPRDCRGRKFAERTLSAHARRLIPSN